MKEFKSAAEEYEYYETEKIMKAYLETDLDEQNLSAEQMMRPMMIQLKGKANPAFVKEILDEIVKNRNTNDLL